MTAISVRGLRKTYGQLEAVRGVDFEIDAGEVFGLLGPNGAGKTTTVEILEGYRHRDAGEVTVLGHDPERPGPEFRQRIGVVLQQSQLWQNITVRETHAMFAGYYEKPRDADEVIELVGLADKRDARVKTLSGGQKRRLDLGVALVGDPDLVFLDEPTTGFDPAARRAAWEMIRSLRSLGKTVLLTTHYLDEAEQLADRVAVMREGRIVRIGTPRELTTSELEVEVRYRRNGEEVLVRTREPTRTLHELTSAALARGEELDRLEVRRPTLEDVYLSLTGGRRTDRVRLFTHQLRAEQLVFWRSKEAALFIFLFPLLLFVLLGSVYSGKIYGVAAPQALLAGLIGYGCANTAFAGLAIQLVLRRESAILKRLRATPLPAQTYVAALLASTLLVFALQTVALLAIGRAFYGTPFPSAFLSLAATVVLGSLAFAALGVAVASLIRSGEGSSAVVNYVLLPMAFLTGSFGPTRHYPAFLRDVGDALPLKYLIDLLNAIYLHGHAFWTKPLALGVLGAWGAVGLVVAVWKFRWEPREG